MAETLRIPPEPPRPGVDDWFNREAHPRSTVLAAQQSRLPGKAAVVHQLCRPGTSMLHSGHDSLAAMTNCETVASSARAPTVVGDRGTSRQRVLEADPSGALQVPPIRRPPEYQCTFWFLRCSHKFSDELSWRLHMEQHFGGAEAPPSSNCCFCGGTFAWSELLKHLKTNHFVLGHRIAHGRPDFGLINYLKNKRVITDQDWKDLQGTEESRPATASLSALAARQGSRARTGLADTPYMVMYNPREQRRRQDGRR